MLRWTRRTQRSVPVVDTTLSSVSTPCWTEAKPRRLEVPSPLLLNTKDFDCWSRCLNSGIANNIPVSDVYVCMNVIARCDIIIDPCNYLLAIV